MLFRTYFTKGAQIPIPKFLEQLSRTTFAKPGVGIIFLFNKWLLYKIWQHQRVYFSLKVCTFLLSEFWLVLFDPSSLEWFHKRLHHTPSQRVEQYPATRCQWHLSVQRQLHLVWCSSINIISLPDEIPAVLSLKYKPYLYRFWLCSLLSGCHLPTIDIQICGTFNIAI